MKKATAGSCPPIFTQHAPPDVYLFLPPPPHSPLLKLVQSFRRLRAHRPGQIPEGGGVGEVEFVGVVVLQHPGKHRVLHEVIVGPPGQRVQVHQVLEVGHLSSL